jgi:hypothetical protein
MSNLNLNKNFPTLTFFLKPISFNTEGINLFKIGIFNILFTINLII